MTWRLHALRYARSALLQVSEFVEGAPHAERVALSWHFYIASCGDRVIAIDTGTDELALEPDGVRAAKWRIAWASTVPEVLKESGVAPEAVTDVILTHHHWDHTGGLEHFANAEIHVHEAEWCALLERSDPARRERLRSRRVKFVTTDGEIAPGLALEEAGAHTAHHLIVVIECAAGTHIVAGDAAYLSVNVDELRAVSCAVDRSRNVRDLRRLRDRVGAARVLPGHEPALFVRFPLRSTNVAVIGELA